MAVQTLCQIVNYIVIRSCKLFLELSLSILPCRAAAYKSIISLYNLPPVTAVVCKVVIKRCVKPVMRDKSFLQTLPYGEALSLLILYKPSPFIQV